MDNINRKRFDKARAKGMIKFKNDDRKRFIGKEHSQCVDNTLAIVAKDRKTNAPRRLASLSLKIHECVREPKESFTVYGERFSKLAQAFLNLGQGDGTGRDGQMFSLFLLKNAVLHHSNYHRIMNMLVADEKNNLERCDTVVTP